MKFMRKIRIGFVGHSYSRGNFGLCALAFGEQDPCNDNPKIKLEEYRVEEFIKLYIFMGRISYNNSCLYGKRASSQ